MKVQVFTSKLKKIRDYLEKWHISPKNSFILMGIISTGWFLLRVIPKPSRANYPCMQATAPIMSGFVIYLIGLAGGLVAFRRMTGHLLKRNYLKVVSCFMIFLVAGFVLLYTGSDRAEAIDLQVTSNFPVGIPQGIFPGRVVWVWDPAATNENCTNTLGDYWWEDKNTNQAVVENMLDSAIIRIAGTTSVGEAWDEIFRFFNKKKHGIERGYQVGEKVAIKLNLTNSSGFGYNTNERMDQTPQLVLALLKHLVFEVGINEVDITVGDPYRKFQDAHYVKCHSIFPDIVYIDGHGQNGRAKTQPSDNQIIEFNNGEKTSSIPKHYLDADYFINMSCLKSHQSTGITLCAKNHMGSVLEKEELTSNQSAGYLHSYLPDNNPGYGKYRQLLDFMGNENLGGNTLLYLVDAIWSGTGWEGNIQKWDMEPFNGDYTSSLFLSLDPVAIESVGYDFLLTENPGGHVTNKEGVDDYLLQAADPANWPTGYTYKTSPGGSALSSLGVYEHWNNSSEKQYTVNITGNIGVGIHLVSVPYDLVKSELIDDNSVAISELSYDIKTGKVYPNPVNIFSQLEFCLNFNTNIRICLLDMSGKTILIIDEREFNAGNHKIQIGRQISQIPNGQYIVKINAFLSNTVDEEILILKN